MSTPFVPLAKAEISWDKGVPHSLLFDACHFANQGSLRQAHTVFVEGNNLIARWQALHQDPPSHFVIAETGFGAGLNFLLTWSLWQKYAPAQAQLHFISCESHPLSRDDLASFAQLWPELHEFYQALLADYPVLTPGFHRLQLNSNISLTLMLGEVSSCYNQLLICADKAVEAQLREYYIDAWFLDGGTTKNTILACREFLHTMALLSKKTTTLAARDPDDKLGNALTNVGFRVTFSQNILQAEFDKTVTRHSKRHTPWHVNVPINYKNRHAIIIGAGLAGCYSAHALARRGWSITLMDKRDQVGSGASGVPQAVLYPKLSAYCSPLNEFMLSAYLYALRTYPRFLHGGAVGELKGILQLAYNPKEQDALDSLNTWLKHYPELGCLVSPEQAADLAGILLPNGGLYMPGSGWINSQALCEVLIDNPNIHWVPDTDIDSLYYQAGAWQVGDKQAEVVIITNGHNAFQYDQTRHLPLKSIRGQMTAVASNELSSKLKIPVCGDAHVFPGYEGLHNIGATYHSSSVDTSSYRKDDQCNLSRLKQLSLNAIWDDKAMSSWVGIRAATPDYLPLVGPVANAACFNKQFSGLASNAKRWIPYGGEYHPGLYLCAGFGSRGLTTIPISAEWLASLINKEPGCLPRNLIQAISPARFLRKSIIRSFSPQQRKS